MRIPWRVGRRAIIVLLLLMSLAAGMTVRADRFVFHDGRTLEADVVAEDEQHVTVTLSGVGSSLTRRIDKSQIKTWYKPSREGPAYVMIPVIGTIGEDVTAEALRAGFDEARAANPRPRYVVLAIDSLGGSIGEMIEILGLIKTASEQFEVVAYVKRACSTAAVIAVACPELYMLPDAAIGATVPWRPTENGPREVDAKFRSFIEATVRAANRHGPQADLLIRGMGEIDLEIYLSPAERQPGPAPSADAGAAATALATAPAPAPAPAMSTTGPGKLIKSKGQILSLTADEAVEYGLAKRTTGMADLGRQLSGGPWHEANRRAWNATTGAVALQQKREAEELRQHRQRAALVRLRPELDSIERRLTQLVAKSIAAQKAAADITTIAKQELEQVDADYKQAAAKGNPQRALEARNARAAEVRQRHQNTLARLQSDRDAALVEITLLRDRHQRLLATVPGD